MVLQEKEGYICESNQKQRILVLPWRYATMEGELIGYLLPSGQLDVYQSLAYYNYSQRASHQFGRYCSSLHPGRCKNKDIHVSPHRFGV